MVYQSEVDSIHQWSWLLMEVKQRWVDVLPLEKMGYHPHNPLPLTRQKKPIPFSEKWSLNFKHTFVKVYVCCGGHACCELHCYGQFGFWLWLVFHSGLLMCITGAHHSRIQETHCLPWSLSISRAHQPVKSMDVIHCLPPQMLGEPPGKRHGYKKKKNTPNKVHPMPTPCPLV